jgi:hypothetical protein
MKQKVNLIVRTYPTMYQFEAEYWFDIVELPPDITHE